MVSVQFILAIGEREKELKRVKKKGESIDSPFGIV
jgi:hypothetical protein